jgi:hypothetical protein
MCSFVRQVHRLEACCHDKLSVDSNADANCGTVYSRQCATTKYTLFVVARECANDAAPYNLTGNRCAGATHDATLLLYSIVADLFWSADGGLDRLCFCCIDRFLDVLAL